MKNGCILVTGGTGYIGSNLIKSLLKKGWPVATITRKESDIQILSSMSDKVEIHLSDGSTRAISNIFEKVKPFAVIHLASLYITNHKEEDIENLIASNVLYGTQIIDAAVKSNTKYFINTGTSWQHYNNENYNPVNLYAATKQSFESICEYYLKVSDIRLLNLKLFDTFGPGDTRKKLFYLLRNASICKSRLKMSPGNQLLDLVYIDDVLDAFHKAIELLTDMNPGKAEYAVSSGAQIPLKKVADTYMDITGRRIDIEWGGVDYRDREVMKPWTNFKPVPGWVAKTSLADGISKIEQKIAD